eukprot:312467-Alexandrium_andersonii.AAC.1
MLVPKVAFLSAPKRGAPASFRRGCKLRVALVRCPSRPLPTGASRTVRSDSVWVVWLRRGFPGQVRCQLRPDPAG